MAGDWIKIEHSLPDKPEVMEMAVILGIDPDAVVGKLIRVWTWFDNHTDDGNAPVTVRALLDRYTGVSNFVATMQDVGWMKEFDGNLHVTHFTRHNGQTAKNRANTNRRVAKSRFCNANVTLAPLQKPLQKPLPEKRREEKSNHLSDDLGKNQKFQKPTIEEIQEYASTMSPPFAQSAKFHAYYESNGWRVGRNPMKDWKAAVRTWTQNEKPNHREVKASKEFSNIKHELPILNAD